MITKILKNLDKGGEIFSRESVGQKRKTRRLNLLSWLYWAAGTAVGCLAGGLIKVNTSGLEFSLTALFIVIVMEMFKNDKNYKVLGAACLFGVAGVALMPAKEMLVGSMALCFVFILVFKDKL